MPCRVDIPDVYSTSKEDALKRKLALQEAISCMLMSRMPKEVQFYAEDFKRAGITVDEFKQWWIDHQTRDIEREIRERLVF